MFQTRSRRQNDIGVMASDTKKDFLRHEELEFEASAQGNVSAPSGEFRGFMKCSNRTTDAGPIGRSSGTFPGRLLKTRIEFLAWIAWREM